MAEGRKTAVRFASQEDLGFVMSNGHHSIPDERVKQMIAGHGVVVAERAGEPVAYACLDYLAVVFPYLAAIWVLEEHRRRGIGKAILQFLEDRCRRQGHDLLYSSSVVVEQPPQEWHRYVGFEECGFIAGMNGNRIGEVFFRKRLHENDK